MYKPNRYDETQISRPKVEEGGHKAVIKKVEEAVSRSSKNMIIVYFDFESSDCQPGFFAKEFRDDVRPEKKWPVLGRKYILVEDSEGNTNRDFKAFVTSAEESNNFKVNWEGDYSQFVGKKIGAVFGPVENEYQGRTFIRNELRYFCSVEKAATAEVPKLKELKPATSSQPPVASNGFMTIPDELNDPELPFN